MIHYHGTPIGGTKNDAVDALMGRHALVSFANPQQMEIVAECCSSFVLDNGAYSFWSGKRHPDWEAWAEWANKWSRHPGYDWALIPDTIDGTLDDNKRLIFHYGRRVPHGVPVYHLHEPLDHLDNLIRNWPRVALGSSGQWKDPDTDAWWDRINEVMKVACDSAGYPRTKLHGLRMLDPDVFKKLPLSSADSCNAGRNNNATRTYQGPTAGWRARVIAARIEMVNSAETWKPHQQQAFQLYAENE